MHLKITGNQQREVDVMQIDFGLILLLAWFVLPLLVFFYQGLKAMLKARSEYKKLKELELDETYR